VPTFAEAGVPQLNDPSWFGLVGPAKLPDAVLARVHEAVTKALAAPEVRERLRQAGAVPAGISPREFAAQIRREIAATSAWPPRAASASNKPKNRGQSSSCYRSPLDPAAINDAVPARDLAFDAAAHPLRPGPIVYGAFPIARKAAVRDWTCPGS
jgi:hypothetical protein